MLFLLFKLGKNRYALEASRVVEVLPLLELRKVSNSPRGVAGTINYRGRPVEVVDLSELMIGRPATEILSTRIVLVNHSDIAGRVKLVGLIAEQATEIIRREPDDFMETGPEPGSPGYLGPMLLDDRGAIQWVRHQRMLPQNVRDLLFCES